MATDAVLAPTLRDRTGTEVDHDVGALHHPIGRDRLLAAAQHRTNAGQQLVGAERLGEVVVGTHVQGPHLVALRPARRDDDHRRLLCVPIILQVPQDVRPVPVRQRQVQDDRAWLLVFDRLDDRSTPAQHERLETVLAQLISEHL